MKHLYKNYYLDADKLNYIICEKNVIKNSKKIENIGNEKYDAVGYYGTIGQVITKLKELCVIENITSVESESIIKELSEINKYVYDNDIMSVKKGSMR